MKKPVMVLISLCMALMMMPFAASASTEYDQAMDLLRQERYSEAGQIFSTLGNEGDAKKLAMYCAAVTYGEQGLFTIAVTNLQSLGDFMDAQILARYYTALSYEAAEEYEEAAERFSGYELYGDVMQRLQTYPERINARDYRKADENEREGNLAEALEGFIALGSYQDSADRAAVVGEKINARDYAAADQAERNGELEDALKGFEALEGYSDSGDRAAAVREKISARDYAAADAMEQAGDLDGALAGFEALGGYRDSSARADAVRIKAAYARAMRLAEDGMFSEAYALFESLGDYEDSTDKAYVLSVVDLAESMTYLGRGMAAFQVRGVWGLIDLDADDITAPYWDTVSTINRHDLIRVSLNGRYGYVGRDGSEVVPVRFAAVSDYQDGLVTVAVKDGSDHLFGLYDAAGRELTGARWKKLGGSTSNSSTMRILQPRPVEGRIKVQDPSGKWGFIATDGNVIGEVKWDDAVDFSEGMAVVRLGDQYGFIDADGLEKIAPKYQDALPFSQGLAAVKTGDKYQYIDQDDQVVIPPIYSKAASFDHDRAYVYLPETGWQVITPTGEQVYFITKSTREAYAAAGALMAEGKYQEAYDIYRSITGYKDVDSLLKNDPHLAAVAAEEEAAEAERDNKFAVGNTVAFGSYPQTEEGTDMTPVEWIVLARDGMKVLLISRYALDSKPYHTVNTDATWEICALREWLNNDFIAKAFTSEEQAGIVTVTVDNSASQGNSDWNIPGGSDTEDKVFLLSFAEARSYFDSRTARRCAPTDYAIANGAFTGDDLDADGRATGYWWLRSPGTSPSSAAAVSTIGALGRITDNSDARILVRPAIWVDLGSGAL